MPARSPIGSVNDFVVRFANVNGSGSASANELFARSVLRMGVPVSARNIFPSNIQGLPTWYEVRISEAGHLGARGGLDLMVAMNPQTWDKGVAGIDPGGYLFYDSTKPCTSGSVRGEGGNILTYSAARRGSVAARGAGAAAGDAGDRVR
jgi:2-oxoglutarate ferredoxin oxidoreductase subunit alpha